MTNDKIYIHYGTNELREELFDPIKNRKNWNKPTGGLWASPENSNYQTWKEFCLANKFRLETLNYSVKFKLKENADVLRITSVEELNYLPPLSSPGYNFMFSFDLPRLIDWEYLAKDFDAIEIEMNNDLYWELYGWDVDTLLIFNLSIIEVI